LIVGAGLAGLTCARELAAAGCTSEIVEASERAGGRVATDRVEGFTLDRGFQVFLTAYPEARRALDYDALSLKPFYAGALVRSGGGFHRLADPFRHPLDAALAAFSPAGTLDDKLRVGRLRGLVARGPVESLFARPETTTAEALRREGFSGSITEQFFRPFFAGVFLERELRTSSRMFEFTFRMFAEGDAAVPSAGMGAIPEQLAASLPGGSIRLRAPVAAVQTGAVTLADGERMTADAVVVAADQAVARRLLGRTVERANLGGDGGSRDAVCLYFAAERPPVAEPILILDGEGRGPVNNLCVPSAVAPSYAPAGAALVSASVVDGAAASLTDERLEEAVREQLIGWFGRDVRGWRHLRTYRIARALPEQGKVTLCTPNRTRTARRGVYVCGDHTDTASINGAMRAGRLAAAAVAEDALGAESGRARRLSPALRVRVSPVSTHR
jgi:phytoene dehydrogenase-like protein